MPMRVLIVRKPVAVDACLNRAGPMSYGINTVYPCCCTCQSKNATPLDQNAPIRVQWCKTCVLSENGFFDRKWSFWAETVPFHKNAQPCRLTDKMDKTCVRGPKMGVLRLGAYFLQNLCTRTMSFFGVKTKLYRGSQHTTGTVYLATSVPV